MTERNTSNHSAEKSGWLIRTVRWLETESYKFLAPISPILIAVWGVLNRKVWYDYWWLMGLGLLFAILGVFWGPRKPSYTQLRADYAHLKKRYEARGSAVERALETLLQKLAIHCDTDTHHDRVSAYYYHAGEFVIVGRYSKNPEHRKDGRKTYPVNQGTIGKAWAASEGAYMRSYPANRERWIERMIENGFSLDQAENLTMQARTIAAFRVEDSGGSVGALVIESTDPKHIDANTLSIVQDSLVYEAIADFIGGSSPETPKAVDRGAGEPASLFDAEWKLAAKSQ